MALCLLSSCVSRCRRRRIILGGNHHRNILRIRCSARVVGGENRKPRRFNFGFSNVCVWKGLKLTKRLPAWILVIIIWMVKRRSSTLEYLKNNLFESDGQWSIFDQANTKGAFESLSRHPWFIVASCWSGLINTYGRTDQDRWNGGYWIWIVGLLSAASNTWMIWKWLTRDIGWPSLFCTY